MWARASTAPPFIPARDAIVTALKKGPMTIPALARDTGKGTSTVQKRPSSASARERYGHPH
jgi:hypothetical protein